VEVEEEMERSVWERIHDLFHKNSTNSSDSAASSSSSSDVPDDSTSESSQKDDSITVHAEVMVVNGVEVALDKRSYAAEEESERSSSSARWISAQVESDKSATVEVEAESGAGNLTEAVKKLIRDGNIVYNNLTSSNVEVNAELTPE
jgi:hypothetical protein